MKLHTMLPSISLYAMFPNVTKSGDGREVTGLPLTVNCMSWGKLGSDNFTIGGAGAETLPTMVGVVTSKGGCAHSGMERRT